jgi:hypothetical protein
MARTPGAGRAKGTPNNLTAAKRPNPRPRAFRGWRMWHNEARSEPGGYLKDSEPPLPRPPKKCASKAAKPDLRPVRHRIVTHVTASRAGARPQMI